MVAAGAVIGIAAGMGADRVLQRVVEGMRPAEPSTFGVMVAALAVATLAAGFLPARRAGRVDPMKALRYE